MTFSPEYLRYIHSPEWFALRERKFRQVGRKCQDCGATGRLHVHHVTYKRLGHEWLMDLRVLCPDCHDRRHKWKRRRKAVADFFGM